MGQHRENGRSLGGVRESKRGTRLGPGASSSVSARFFFARGLSLRHSSSPVTLIMRRLDCRRLQAPASASPFSSKASS